MYNDIGKTEKIPGDDLSFEVYVFVLPVQNQHVSDHAGTLADCSWDICSDNPGFKRISGKKED